MVSFERYYSRKANPIDIINFFKMNHSKTREKKLKKDEHQYLVDIFLIILEAKKKLDSNERDLGLWDKDNMWNLLALNETVMFSVLDSPAAIRALSLYAIYKRIPTQSYQYIDEYEKIMKPIIKMCKDGKFANFYKESNPKVSKIIDPDKFVFPDTPEVYEKGLELVDLEAIDIPHKRLNEYLSVEKIGALSLFTQTNIYNKVRCFYSKINQIKKAFNKTTSLENKMQEAKFNDMTLLEQKMALEILAKNGVDSMAEFISREITLNADLLY